MVEVQLVQCKRVLFQLWKDSFNKQEQQIFSIQESLFFLLRQLHAVKWFERIFQFILEMSERPSDSVHLCESLVKVEAVSHEEAMEWKARDWFLQNSCLHEIGKAGEGMCDHKVVVQASEHLSLLGHTHAFIALFVAILHSHEVQEF